MHQSEPTSFFIVGCGRSGTSLLRTILNRHSRIAIPTESLFMIDYLRVQERFDLQSLVPMIVKEPEIREWGIDVDISDFTGCRSLPEILSSLHEIYAKSKGKDIWGQKTPRFVRHLPVLGSSFHKARFLHVVRDPRAVVNSLIHSDVHHSTPFHASKRWLIDISAGLSFEKAAPERVLRIYYEEFIRETEKHLKEIASFLGIGFEEDMLTDYQGTQEYSSFYNNIHHNLDHELSTEHIDKWKRQLDQRTIQLIESMVHEEMVRLGYSPAADPIPISANTRIRMQLRRIPGLIRQLSKYTKQRREYLLYTLKRKWKLGLLKEFLWTINY